MLAALFFFLFSAPAVHAHSEPVGCTGSGLGILLFTDAPDVHIGDTLNYSVTVFNGTGNGPVVCDSTGIQAFVVTPDLVSHPITLVRTTLLSGQSDFYTNVVSYVVRAQDVRPDGTVRSTASDTGVIHQNDTDSQGGGNQGVNTEVSLPCIQLLVQCAGGIGENGAINYTGTVTNCGNNTLVGVTVTNFVNGQMFQVAFITNLLKGQIATFNGSWIPSNACSSSTATLVAQGIDQYTTHPRTVTSSTDTTCQNTLTPGIKVTKSCPVVAPAPGQLLTFSGSVSNSGNVTLTNIVVVNNQPSANTQVFTVSSLAPGASTNFTGSYTAPASCSVSDTLTATATSRCGAAVSDSATAICPISTTPGITVTEVCPLVPGVSGGTSSFSGVVSNSGNVTLTNVVVISDRPSANTVVLTVGSLAPGVSSNYSGTFTVPLNVCSVTTGIRATGSDTCGGTSVTNTTSSTCPVTTAPAIAVTLACPLVPSTNGGSITYTGTVRNSGNVTLTNIVVTDSQSSPTTVFTAASLAPGVTANFTASFTAPINTCSVTSTVNAHGNDYCSGVVVSNSTTTTCALMTTPKIVVTQNCSTNATSPGGVLTYSGSISNAGNIALTNVVVTNDRTGSTNVFAMALLLPGVSTNFTGSYVVPVGSDCSITSTLTARGNDNCSGSLVTNSTSATCSITGTPVIAVTVNCPGTAAVTGSSITFSGTVSNPGNVALINVTVVDAQASPSTVLSLPSLAPGASANFTATFLSPANACSVTTTVTARGNNTCAGVVASNTASATCTLLTTSAIVVRQNCPVVAATAGGVLNYSGSVSNAGNITLTNIVVVNNQSAPATNVVTPAANLFGTINSVNQVVSNRFLIGTNFNGLTYAGEDHGYGATEFYAMHKGAGTSFFDTIIASTATTTDRFTAGTNSFDALAYAAPDVGYGQAIFYYLRHDAAGVSTFGSITPGGVTGVVADHFVVGSHFDALTFSATDVGYGANMFYYVRHDANGVSTFGTINPTPGGIVTDRFIVGTNVDALVFTDLTAPGYGANNFYYLRHDANGVSTFGTIFVTGLTTGTVTDRFTVGSNVTGLTFSATDVGFGANLFYFLRAPVTITSSNAPSSFTVSSLAPGASTNFTGSYVVPITNVCSVTTVVTATATDVCSGNTITNKITTTCPLATAPAISVSLNCPANASAPGGLTTYTGTVQNSGNVTLNNVTVVNNQSSPTTVLTVASLAAGASANFTASFTAPLDTCSVSSTVVARGADACSGSMVTNNASATCPLVTAPLLTVTQNCPTSVSGSLTYTGTVHNGGNITLTNVIVRNDRTGTNIVFAVATLAPGATANFTGTYSALVDACSLSSTVTATAKDKCTGSNMVATATSNCPLPTNPKIVITQSCPVIQVTPGSLLTYSGTISNAGNSTLTNVVVTNDRTGSTNVFTIASLAPRATTNFTGTYRTRIDCCVDSSTVTVTGRDCNSITVRDTATRTCTLLTHPAIALTTVCSDSLRLLAPGDTLTFSGTISNAGNITLTGVTIRNNVQTNGSLVFGPITLAAGESIPYTASFVVPADFCGTVIARGYDFCSGSPVEDSAASCPVTTSPRIAVTMDCPAQPTPRHSMFNYTGTVSNPGNVTLTNVYVVNDKPAANTAVFGPITLAPGASMNFSGSYKVTCSDCCDITDTLTASGRDRCAGTLVAATVTEICPLLTTPRIAVVKECPATAVAVGGLYEFTGAVTNIGDVVLTNVYVFSSQPVPNTLLLGPIELAPGEWEEFSGSYIVVAGSNPANDTVTASGTDTCDARTVAATVDCSGPDAAVPGPMLKGTYNGLFYNANEVQNSNSGFFTFSVKTNGTYTASLKSIGRTNSTSGTLNLDGKATNTVVRPHTNALTVAWHVHTDGSDKITGTVSDGTWVSDLTGDRAVFNTLTNKAPQMGRYTLIIPGASGAVSPEGDGYGTAVVDGNGIVRMTGRLADGVAMAQNVAISKNGEWPVYVSLYAGRGSLLGWMLFTNTPTDDMSGTLSWIRPAMPTAKFYPAGFGVDSESVGSRYVAPGGITNSVLRITNGVVTFSGGNLSDTFANDVLLSIKSKITNLDTNNLSMSFTLSSGVFKGSFRPAGTTRSNIFSGVVLQKANEGSGYFLGTNQSGRVLFNAAP